MVTLPVADAFRFAPPGPDRFVASWQARALDKLRCARHGDLPRWNAALSKLPERRACRLALEQEAPGIGLAEELAAGEGEHIDDALNGLRPWRKGPFSLFGVELDAEWRCSLKWQRIAHHVDFQGARVLDIGSGNGYYCLRALGAGARYAVGVDPSWLHVAQFAAFARYLEPSAAWVLPFALEELVEPADFDVVMSLGVLYHRREPLDHLRRLHEKLTIGGQLVLESLIVDDAYGDILVPHERYAGMRNVWNIPSPGQLCRWVEESGFHDPRVVDVSVTSTQEQRVTAYSGRHSLENALDPARSGLTVEGYPRPSRAVVLARG